MEDVQTAVGDWRDEEPEALTRRLIGGLGTDGHRDDVCILAAAVSRRSS
jgi:hypothetical protein